MFGSVPEQIKLSSKFEAQFVLILIVKRRSKLIYKNISKNKA